MATKKAKLTPFQEEQSKTLKKIKEYKLEGESGVVSVLYKNPDLLYDSNLTLDDFDNNVWRVYFTIISELILVEKKMVVDDVTVGLYLEKHDKLRAKYNEYGGWATIKSSEKYTNPENFYGYLTALKKWKSVLALCARGFPVADKLSEFADMTLEEIKAAIEKRDEMDKNKKEGSLKIAPDALYIDTSDLTIDKVCEIILNKIS
jgi:replicative DNA helicase